MGERLERDAMRDKGWLALYWGNVAGLKAGGVWVYRDSPFWCFLDLALFGIGIWGLAKTVYDNEGEV